MHDPKYYILDEPTSGLDIISSKVILDTIKDEKDKGKCILYSTHYMEEAESICDRVVLMNNGKIITIGTPEEIKKKTNTSNLREAFFALTGVIIMNNILITLKKELKLIIRDKKSLLMMAITPLFIPIFVILMSYIYEELTVNKDDKTYQIGVNYELSSTERIAK